MIMLKIIISITTLASALLLAIVLNISTPAVVGPFGILAVFIFAYLSSLGVMTFFIYFMSRLGAYISTVFVTRRPYIGLTFRRSYYFSTVIAAAPVMFIGLQSVGAISAYGFLLILLFVLIGCLYISKKVN